ncbi:homeobox protein DBX2-like [Schistocerca piceifrons]|uniref:homeobox protein DBX2-like n=1 Tax=Schistocerca piceifrons TaxID=274613 RepID=UPI001F5E5E71|nr:homeobox protein DBX2-like [Schistocerca piceifrons]
MPAPGRGRLGGRGWPGPAALPSGASHKGPARRGLALIHGGGRSRRRYAGAVTRTPHLDTAWPVKIWFQNRRMKWRNSKERELLASGGSREQTLPNKNNPHPDLSDAEQQQQQQQPGASRPLPDEELTPPEDDDDDEEINVT